MHIQIIYMMLLHHIDIERWNMNCSIFQKKRIYCEIWSDLVNFCCGLDPWKVVQNGECLTSIRSPDDILRCHCQTDDSLKLTNISTSMWLGNSW